MTDGTHGSGDGDDTGVGASGDAADTDFEFESDAERVDFLRDIADEIRGDSTEREQLANVLYRTSDLYDEREDTSPEEIVRNMKVILEVIERGGLDR
ncbi:hypothetical protein [Natrinema gelatinilyticum]|uniref:hypothetical protein n=1 Tax=Natrinema gelatinilyticum TaxID=2961571 RepID=UPI0020C38C74|nr:hypothetical protein [Natrinema gelatinilyticum]